MGMIVFLKIRCAQTRICDVKILNGLLRAHFIFILLIIYFMFILTSITHTFISDLLYVLYV